MRINVYYFSATGNSRWVTKEVVNQLKKYNHEVSVKCVEKEMITPSEIREADLIGFIYPIYSSKPPQHIINALEILPQVEGKLTFFVTTAGYIAGDVNLYTYGLIKHKGYLLLTSLNIVMGNNLHLPRLCPLPVSNKNAMESKRRRANKKIEKVVGKIQHNESYIEGRDIFSYLFGIFQRLIGDGVVEHGFKGFQIEEECCSKCGWCLKNCPNQNIVMEKGKIRFLEHCTLCTRCYNFCPQEAIICGAKTKKRNWYKRYKGPEGKGIKSL